MQSHLLLISFAAFGAVLAFPQTAQPPPSSQLPQTSPGQAIQINIPSELRGFANGLGIALDNGTVDVGSTICGIFTKGNLIGDALSSMMGDPFAKGKCVKDTSGGSGPYKANFTTDPSLPNHTIYAPKSPPSEKMPVIIWGNGGCLAIGNEFENLHNELASHGFFIVTNGLPGAVGLTSYTMLLDAVDWASTNPAAKKYGELDLENLVIAGQSCGGMEAYQASLNTTKSKMTVLFNSGYLTPALAGQIAEVQKPIAYFLGGPKDIAYESGTRDYANLKPTVPALMATADIGHIGAYWEANGGIMGKAAVAFMKWKLKGDESQKPLFCNPAPDSALIAAGWNISAKNGMC